MSSALESVAPGKAATLLKTYYQLEPEVEAERPFRSYREVLAETLRRAADREGARLASGTEQVLARTLPDWPVFPDVFDSLSALRAAGWNLAILSNVDRDLIAGSLKRIRVPFDTLVTAEDVRAYKPALEHFLHFQRSAAVARDDWVHVARSYFHDIVPARRLGIKRVWINRGHDPDDPALATKVLSGLEDLPETLYLIASWPAGG